jgi:predicted amidophosphoribosyltransferase
LQRRNNQAALLAKSIGRECGFEYLPDSLIRPNITAVQDGMGRDQRFRNLAGAIKPHPRRSHLLAGRDVLLIDDVMTWGATLAAATDACLAADADRVFVLVLARVAKDA